MRPGAPRLPAFVVAGLLALAVLCCGHPAAAAAPGPHTLAAAPGNAAHGDATQGAGPHGDAAHGSAAHGAAGHVAEHAPAGMPEPVATGDHRGGGHEHAGCTMQEAGPAPSTTRSEPVDRATAVVVHAAVPGPTAIRVPAIRVKGPPPGGTGRDLLHQLSVLRT